MNEYHVSGLIRTIYKDARVIRVIRVIDVIRVIVRLLPLYIP